MSGFKTRTIKKVIEAKLNSWVRSIDDPEVKKAIRENAIVTGGSIASMLLGESPKDYDVYFKTPESAIIVAEHYLKEIDEKRVAKQREKHPDYKPDERKYEARLVTVTNLKGQIEDVVQVKSTDFRKIGTAHGAFMSLDPGVQQEKAAEEILTAESGSEEENILRDLENASKDETHGYYRVVYVSENAITLSNKIQVVLRFTGTPAEIHENYDFAHCKNVYDYSAQTLTCDPLALECLLSKTLRYTGSLYPLCSIFRAKKFIERGWRISAGELLKIAYQTSRIDFNNLEQLREQLVGVDALYFYHLMDKIKTRVETGETLEGCLIDLIDEVFNA